jgi:hypothetical protein
MEKSIQEKIEALEKLAQASSLKSSLKVKKVSAPVEDSLSRLIKTQKDADIFMAQIDAIVRMERNK